MKKIPTEMQIMALSGCQSCVARNQMQQVKYPSFIVAIKQSIDISMNGMGLGEYEIGFAVKFRLTVFD